MKWFLKLDPYGDSGSGKSIKDPFRSFNDAISTISDDDNIQLYIIKDYPYYKSIYEPVLIPNKITLLQGNVDFPNPDIPLSLSNYNLPYVYFNNVSYNGGILEFLYQCNTEIRNLGFYFYDCSGDSLIKIYPFTSITFNKCILNLYIDNFTQFANYAIHNSGSLVIKNSFINFWGDYVNEFILFNNTADASLIVKDCVLLLSAFTKIRSNCSFPLSAGLFENNIFIFFLPEDIPYNSWQWIEELGDGKFTFINNTFILIIFPSSGMPYIQVLKQPNLPIGAANPDPMLITDFRLNNSLNWLFFKLKKHFPDIKIIT